MARHIGQNAERHADDGRGAGAHAVHAVVEVGSVRHRRDHQNGHDDEENPSGGVFMLAEDRHHLVVAQIVVFHERNRRFQRFHRLRLVRDNGFHALFLGGDVLVEHGVGTQPERQADDEADGHLSDNLPLAFQAVFVLAENLDVIVEKAQKTEPDRGDNHQNQVDVPHAAQQQHGHENRHGNDDAAHRRYADFLLAEGVDAAVAGGFADVATLHILDEPLAEPCRNQQRDNQREQGAERNVAPHARPGNVVLL